MMGKPNPNHLVVEGQEDLYAIASLMGKHVNWGAQKEDAPVKIYPAGGVDDILDTDNIASRLKATGLQRLGFIVDADDSCESRWESLRNFLKQHFSDFPINLDPSGVVYVSQSGLRVGVWVMPDNGSVGMLESLLSQLVPREQTDVFEYAKSTVLEASGKGAKYRSVHKDKAIIHTWLAWADPPGLALGNAVLKSMLDGRNPCADKFVSWFKDLYEL